MQVHWPKRNRRFGALDVLGVLGVIGFLVAHWVPVARLPFWGCALRETTGWPCPGCGLTRVAERVSQGNLPGAWDASPLGTVAALLFIGIIAVSALHLTFAVPVPSVTLNRRQTQWLWGVLVVVALANWGWMAVKARFPELLYGAWG